MTQKKNNASLIVHAASNFPCTNNFIHFLTIYTFLINNYCINEFSGSDAHTINVKEILFIQYTDF